jgi:hypothetical protein
VHEPLVEALPGILGAASAVGGVGGMMAIAGASLRRKKKTGKVHEAPATDQAPDEDLSSVNSP